MVLALISVIMVSSTIKRFASTVDATQVTLTMALEDVSGLLFKPHLVARLVSSFSMEIVLLTVE